MASVAELLAAARQHIPPSEARLLLGHLLGRDNAWLEAHREDAVVPEVAEKLSALAIRRGAGEPVAYLLGMREFYGRDFAVTPDVLIPRPETELLIDIAKEKLFASDAVNILDLGAGSGCIAVTLALELDWARVVAVDVSPAALEVARGNARRLGAQAQLEFVEGDWFTGLSLQRFDLIVANPPYVASGDPHLAEGDLRFEPQGALTDHADGLSAIRRIIAEAPRWLARGGWLFLEHGYDQAAAVRALLAAAGFAAIEQRRDLAGIVRVSGGRVLE